MQYDRLVKQYMVTAFEGEFQKKREAFHAPDNFLALWC